MSALLLSLWATSLTIGHGFYQCIYVPDLSTAVIAPTVTQMGIWYGLKMADAWERYQI